MHIYPRYGFAFPASHAYANITTLEFSIKLDDEILLFTNEFHFKAKELKQWVPLTGIPDLMMFSITQKQLTFLNNEIAH